MVCRNGLCPIDYPHSHMRRPGDPEDWSASINDPAVSAPWPERLKWERPKLDGIARLFRFGWFSSHSGFQLPFKIDLDALRREDWQDIAKIIAWKFAFRAVHGVPTGGNQLARALDPYCEPGYPVLIVDDVLTTGRSMEEARARLGSDDKSFIGVVVVARGPCPSWVWPILQVSDWSQSRATGLG